MWLNEITNEIVLSPTSKDTVGKYDIILDLVDKF
jgi:hypothetical protein